MQIKVSTVNRVEGEVNLELNFDNGIIKDARISAYNHRGFEKILKGRDLMDCLIITPRICGICGHSHLKATVEAIENLYRENGLEIEIPKKAKLIRQITQCSEVVQNHLKWLFLSIMPDFCKFEDSLEDYKPFSGKRWKEGIKYASEIVKVIAIFAGQWPHTSYTIPGGITSEPLNMDIVEAMTIVDNLIKYTQESIVGMEMEEYIEIKRIEDYLGKAKGCVLRDFLEMSLKHGFDSIGKSHNHFITVTNIYPCVEQAVIKKKRCKFTPSKIKELKGQSKTYIPAIRYDGLPMETGPLARRLTSEDKLFYNLHKKFGDSYLVRVWARVDEILKMLLNIKSWLKEIDISEKSYKKPKDYKKLSGESYGFVEAARGSLIHKIRVKNGQIEDYRIITPTMWNLGPRCKRYKGVVEEAIVGLDSELKAQMVLRSFDVCSVCFTR